MPSVVNEVGCVCAEILLESTGGPPEYGETEIEADIITPTKDIEIIDKEDLSPQKTSPVKQTSRSSEKLREIKEKIDSGRYEEIPEVIFN